MQHAARPLVGILAIARRGARDADVQTITISEAARGRGSILTLRASQEAAVYVLNRKRADIAEIEDRYGVTV